MANSNQSETENETNLQLRLEFEFEKSQLYEKLLLHKFLQELTFSDELPSDVKAYCGELLSCQETNSLDQKLFCISPADRLSPKRQRPSNCKSTLQKALTDKLSDLKRTVNGVLSIRSDFSNWSECSDFIKNISDTEKKIKNLNKEKLDLATEYATTLQNYLKIVRNYADEILTSLKLKQYRQTDEWLQKKLNALSLKAKNFLRVVELQFLTETYTTERIDQLKKLIVVYNEKKTNFELKINEIRSNLNAYESVGGPIFDQLVIDYENLEKQIDNKRWALNEFGGNKNVNKD